MIGLTFDKLLVVAFLAAVLVGPQRLPGYTQRLAETARGLRTYVEATRTEATKAGIPVRRADWERLDPRRYDPRRIVTEALRDPGLTVPETAAAGPHGPHGPHGQVVPPPAEQPVAGPTWVVTGSSAHPRRRLVSPPVPVAAQTDGAGQPQLAAPEEKPDAGSIARPDPGLA